MLAELRRGKVGGARCLTPSKNARKYTQVQIYLRAMAMVFKSANLQGGARNFFSLIDLSDQEGMVGMFNSSWSR